MEPIQICASSAQDSTGTPLLPETPETEDVFTDGGAAETGGGDGEDGVGGEAGAVPEAEIEGDGDADAVDEDEGPEEEDGAPAGGEGVVEGGGAGGKESFVGEGGKEVVYVGRGGVIDGGVMVVSCEAGGATAGVGA